MPLLLLRPVLLLATLLCVVLPACQKSPGAELMDQSTAHLQAALKLLQDAHGDERKVLEASMAYRAKHTLEIKALREKGEALLKTLDAAERHKLETDSQNRWTPIVTQIEMEAQKFPQPHKVLRFIRPMLVPATPRGIKGTPWLPEAPPMPKELLEPPHGLPQPPTQPVPPSPQP